MSLHMLGQVEETFLTYVTFLARVYIPDVYIKVANLGRLIVTLLTLIWLVVTMREQMCPQRSEANTFLVTCRTFVPFMALDVSL